MNKLLVSLVNVERETVLGFNFKSRQFVDSQMYKGRPPFNLNLYVMITANFIDKNYDESLKYLSAALEFVQVNDLMTKYNTPELDPVFEKMHLEVVNLGFHELSNLWSILGGKYQPSVLLKIRMFTIDKEELESVEVAAGDIQTEI